MKKAITMTIKSNRTTVRSVKTKYSLDLSTKYNGEHKVTIRRYTKVSVTRKPEIILTIEEANMLDVLTARSKMDCWFYIDDSDLHHMVIRDLENRSKIMDTREAILIVADGITSIYDYRLTGRQIKIWLDLLKRLGIK
ncbi:MAG: hypothetical protein KBT06_04375 [Prevotellaceae bacterium]|nr:hypothetical protein [Candidatus Colivivens equi]